MAKNTKVSLLFSTILISLLLPACSPSRFEKYRYACQDPVNWEDPICNPPLCLVDNMCTDILIGVAPTNVTQESQQDVEQDSTPSECPQE